VRDIQTKFSNKATTSKELVQNEEYFKEVENKEKQLI
jgi:hypothetical protein